MSVARVLHQGQVRLDRRHELPFLRPGPSWVGASPITTRFSRQYGQGEKSSVVRRLSGHNPFWRVAPGAEATHLDGAPRATDRTLSSRLAEAAGADPGIPCQCRSI